eukprot:CAMPEP_0185582638 /NCGR_PEP_ID=MMETSP0434-20130131/21022_1 /TAXON_ID=626734 ORGANISM="Favella taraikaensis, Strain Fe Narragansett Bay" /NCGR_SAMPLE_ID=MMETSP0434 /ASSEMBLY_ACC=CAM_ASM_000379 /LENGTH=37 /DNA_ID= /DNA_START= /DNA_END= /DNA_ORIENTATION=
MKARMKSDRFLTPKSTYRAADTSKLATVSMFSKKASK